MKKTLLILIAAGSVIISCGQRSAKKQETAQETSTTAVINLDLADFTSKVADIESEGWKYLGDKPAVIDFYADWCGPCKTLSPILAEVADQYKDRIVVYKVDVDKEAELATKFGIRNIPALLFIPLEGDPSKTIGLISKDSLETAVKNILLK